MTVGELMDELRCFPKDREIVAAVDENVRLEELEVGGRLIGHEISCNFPLKVRGVSIFQRVGGGEAVLLVKPPYTFTIGDEDDGEID